MLIEKYDLEVFTPPCNPGSERCAARARLFVDISEILPYLNATLLTTGSSWIAYAAGAAGLASLFSLFCLAIIVILPNMVYFPWPHPYADLTVWQHILFYIPYISLVMACLAALLAGFAFKYHTLERSLRVYFLISILALLVFNIMILV